MSGAVLQSGLVTPGHLTSWVTNGVIGDFGAAPTYARVIASAKSVNFSTTFDQPIPIPLYITAFMLVSIIVTNPSMSLATAQGGFYPQPSKGGTPIVAATQSYAALTGSNSLLLPFLSSYANNTRFSAAVLGQIGGLMNIWFSLTTPQPTLATADIYITAIDLS